jgi:phosphoribosylglycinamide formyltransferase-1
MNNIAIFASGSGSNAQRIAEYFVSHSDIRITRIYSNNENAFVLERAAKLNIPTTTFSRKTFYHSDLIMDTLINENTDLIILAGFLWLVPENILQKFKNRIINIHPALLPKYGGKGMYGSHVHEAVISNKETVSGITIHFVNEKYDEGKIIFQAKCKIDKGETPVSLAKKIHKLEYTHFPVIIEEQIQKL